MSLVNSINPIFDDSFYDVKPELTYTVLKYSDGSEAPFPYQPSAPTSPPASTPSASPPPTPPISAERTRILGADELHSHLRSSHASPNVGKSESPLSKLLSDSIDGLPPDVDQFAIIPDVIAKQMGYGCELGALHKVMALSDPYPQYYILTQGTEHLELYDNAVKNGQTDIEPPRLYAVRWYDGGPNAKIPETQD